MSFIFGIVVLALALWALHAFSRVDPRTLAIVLKTGGGIGALGLAGVLGVRGRLDIAIPLGLTGGEPCATDGLSRPPRAQLA
jgi:hypothetical protein